MTISGHQILMLNGEADLYGSNKIMLESATHLKNRGFRPVVILPLEGPIIPEFEKESIEVRIFNFGVIRRKYLNPIGLLGRLILLSIAVIRLVSIVRSERIPLIYSNGLNVLVGAIVARITRTKHIWHVHEILEKPTFLVKFYKTFFKVGTHHFIAVSQAVEKCWNPIINKKSSITTIYNGIEYPENLSRNSIIREELHIDHTTVLIGMIGRVSTWKGQDYFMRIAHELLKDYHEVHFITVGDVYPGNEYLHQELDDLKSRLNIKNKVTDLGFRTDILDILSTLDIFILPSIKPDPFPTVVLEAMGQGKAIVSTRQGGAQEMLEEDVSGVFVPLERPEEAARLIHPLVESLEIRSSLGENAKKRVRELFSREQFGRHIVDKVKKVLEN